MSKETQLEELLQLSQLSEDGAQRLTSVGLTSGVELPTLSSKYYLSYIPEHIHTFSRGFFFRLLPSRYLVNDLRIDLYVVELSIRQIHDDARMITHSYRTSNVLR